MTAVTGASAATGVVIDHYGLRGASVEPLGTGLINETWLVTTVAGDCYVLQCLNAVFDPRVNLDIDAVTRHLEARGAPTQRLVGAAENRLWVEVDGRNWRLSTFVPGVCVDRLGSTQQAAQAGRLLGRFHRQVSSLQLDLHAQRLGVHDTGRHLASLEQALDECAEHRYYDAIAPLAEQVLRAAEALPLLSDLPVRLVHGDPKISNLVFDATTGEGVCMIDLDTLGYMPLPLELGDAIRSWCNPKGEDEARAQFRMDYFAAAIGGYAAEAADLIEDAEWQAFVPAARTIMVELAARFTRDALRESYFGWNAAKFPDRSTHNQVRARGQLNLHDSFAVHAAEAEAAVRRAFG